MFKSRILFFIQLILWKHFVVVPLSSQLYHCVCIYNNIGALSSTIGDRGLNINYDINNIDYVEKTCNDVMELMKNEIKKKVLFK